MPRLHRDQSLLRTRQNIRYHYDLGNDLSRLMLDETVTYSCAVFAQPDESPADVLDIGYGWGPSALAADGRRAPASRVLLGSRPPRYDFSGCSIPSPHGRR